MNELLMTVDLNHLARRVWHIWGAKPDENREMFAVYEFYAYLMRLDTAYHPSKVILASDSPPYFRSKMYPPYKANRPEVADNWETQLYWIKRIAELAGIAEVSCPTYEADDILATIAKRYENTLVITGDKDLLFLVSAVFPSTTVELLRWDKENGTHRKRFSSRIDVKEFLGVFPEQLSLYKALAGDNSDNIPGIKGIGHKKAIMLLENYGTFQGVYDHIHMLTKADGGPFKYAKTLVREKDTVLLFIELCTPVNIQELVLPQAGPLDLKAVSNGLKEMEREREN